MIRRTVTMMTALITSLLLVVSCGVSGDSGFEPIDSDNLPDALTATTTTTTTTTTTIASTSTTIAMSDVTTTAPETTSSVATQIVDVYYVVGRTIVLAQIPFPPDPQVAQVLLTLEQPPTGQLTSGFRTAVPADKMSFVSESRGLVTIDLDPDFFDDLEDRTDPTLAIAQIVMTVTRLSGIALVTFTMSGEPASVLLADSSQSEPGQELNYDDYSSLLTNSPPPVATTTTTTSEAPPAPADSTPVETVPG